MSEEIRAAVIDDETGRVINVVMLDPESEWTPPDGTTVELNSTKTVDPIPPTPEQAAETTIKTGLAASIAEMEAAAETKAAWGALNAAQKDELNRRAVLGVAKLARIVTRKLNNGP